MELIAPDGDVILVVEASGTVKLRISSIVLKGASPVFAAMLGPHFKEGHDLGSTSRPKELTLPEDSGTAISDMCNLLHLTTPEGLCKSPGADRICDSAIAVDKYGCQDALRLQGQALLLGWTSNNATTVSVEALGMMATAAYLLQNKDSFALITSQLVTTSRASYSKLLHHSDTTSFPAQALLALEEKRTAAQRKIVNELLALGTPACTLCPSSIDYAFIQRMSKAVGNVNYWPPQFDAKNNLGNVIARIKSLGYQEIRSGCAHSASKTGVSTSEFTHFAAEVESICHGLCIKCVQEDRPNLQLRCTLREHA